MVLCHPVWEATCTAASPSPLAQTEHPSRRDQEGDCPLADPTQLSFDRQAQKQAAATGRRAKTSHCAPLTIPSPKPRLARPRMVPDTVERTTSRPSDEPSPQCHLNSPTIPTSAYDVPGFKVRITHRTRAERKASENIWSGQGGNV